MNQAPIVNDEDSTMKGNEEIIIPNNFSVSITGDQRVNEERSITILDDMNNPSDHDVQDADENYSEDGSE